jgi:diadenosine tetraphosphate (Ap4A) HIT family hydrolase
VPGFEVPGWVVVRVRRHTIGWPGLDEAERARVGDALAETVAAVRTATGVDKVYVLTFGEAFPHFHALVAPRPDDLPVELRLGRILDRREHDLDVPAAREVAARVRTAYEQQARDRAGAA